MTDVLAGRRAVVCGSTQGIGRACAMELARLGAAVTLLARNESALRAVLAELPLRGNAQHDVLVADFAKPDELSKVAQAYAQGGRAVHILINNTGGPPHGSILEASGQDFANAFAQHVVCNQLLTRAFVPGMTAAKFGRIINIISTSVLQPIRGLGVSNTTRGAVANWGRSMAAELAPIGITVNNILPGFTDTQRLRQLLEHKALAAKTTIEDIVAQSCKAIPAGRFADPAEIAAVVGFLATPAASYLTGVNLPVDGGRTAAQ